MKNEYFDTLDPLYTVKAYENGLYRVSKRLCSRSRFSFPRPLEEEGGEKVETEGKFDSAMIRAKNIVREYALCNTWDYFLTITFNIDQWNRYDLEGRVRELMQYFQNLRKRVSGFERLRYLLVPEFHKDGAVHFHGLISGIPEQAIDDLPPWAPIKTREHGNKHIPLFTNRYGWCTLSPIISNVGVGFYISKYITKSMASMAALKGVHTYYHSRGLNKAVVVGWQFVPNSLLDKCCKYKNSFYATGFCKFDYVAEIAVELEELTDMFMNWSISDPVTGEVLALAGGDTEDECLQLMLDLIRDDGYAVLPYDVGA